MMGTEQVILVDERDRETGVMEKMEAHREGLLHRAFSIFIFDKTGRMLLHQRSENKYHCGGLWTNACCSHPRPGEEIMDAARRRLKEELGFVCELKEVAQFTYKAKVDNELTEHEFDHVFVGNYDGPLNINKDEVMAVSFLTEEELAHRMEASPDLFTPWFRIALPIIRSYWKKVVEKSTM